MLKKIIQEGLTRGFETVEVFSEKIRNSTYEGFKDYTAVHHKKNNHAIVRAFRRSGEPLGFKISNPYPSFESFKDAFFNIYSIDTPSRIPNAAEHLPVSLERVKLKIFDRDIESTGPEFFQDLRDRAFETILRYPRLELKKILFQKTAKRIYLFNSRGLRGKYKKTVFRIEMSLTLNRKSITLSDTRTGRNSLSPEKIILRGHRILHSISDQPASLRGKTRFLITPPAAASLLWSFHQCFVINGKHSLKDLKFPPVLNIVDNPILDGEPGSVPFDDEGVQKAPQFLIRKGNIETHISDLREGLRYRTASTGNGFRPPQAIFPRPRFTNLYIQPTTMPLKHLMESGSAGIFITLLKPVAVTGKQYCFLAFGYRFEGEELKEPVHLTLQTRPSNFFLRILKISRQLHFHCNPCNVGSPYLLVEGEHRTGSTYSL